MTSNYIYILIDPFTDEIRYVGKSVNPDRRYYDHVQSARRPKTELYRWIDNILCRGKYPKLQVIEQVDDWAKAERYWIELFRVSGNNLFNILPGGPSPFNKGKKHPDIPNPFCTAGKKHSPEVRQKISERMQGLSRSPETRKKISESKKGKPRPEHVKQKIANSMRKIHEARKPVLEQNKIRDEKTLDRDKG